MGRRGGGGACSASSGDSGSRPLGAWPAWPGCKHRQSARFAAVHRGFETKNMDIAFVKFMIDAFFE
jgi:hypothetical protein